MATRTVLAESDDLAEAVADTEAEIFADATGTEPLDNDGDRSLEEMGDGLEGEADEADADEADEQTEGDEETEAEQEAEQVRDEKTGQFVKAEKAVPSGRLREETERRQAIEAERDQYRRELEAIKAAQLVAQRPQQSQQPQDEAPDMFADPVGYNAYQENKRQQEIARLQADFEAKLVNRSFALAERDNREAFKAAYDEFRQFAEAEAQQFGGKSPTVRQIWNDADPGRALLDWHQQRTIVREIGSDPNAYKQKIRDELMNDPQVRAEVVKRMRSDAGQGDSGRPRSQTRLPPSLNSQTGRGTQQEADPDLYNNSEQSVFDYATR